MRYTKFTIVALAVLLLVAFGCERKVTEEVVKEISPASASYLGSEACGTCHADIYSSFSRTGHPHMLNDAAKVAAGDCYPFSDVPHPPPGTSWDDLSMVLGGFWWNAAFIDKDGYFITGAEAEYNLADQSWSAYREGEVAPYSCASCHTTGYDASGNQNGMEGITGTWEFKGIQCERCHGPGELHAADPHRVAMTIDRSSEACGECHYRGDLGTIPAADGFVKDHAQFNEMSMTKHAALKCVDCHDVHNSLHPNNPNREMGLKLKCENCHIKETASFLASGIEDHIESPFGPDCVDCHMPKTAKAAVAAGTYEGDVHSHLWRINTDVDAEMFNEDGTLANGYLTVEYTCLQCHRSENKAWAAGNAPRVHASDVAGVDDCMECHNGTTELGQKVILAQAQWDISQHASGENIDRNSGSCRRCHTNEGFIASVTGGTVSGDVYTAIGCFTCHNPHDEGSFALRNDDEVELENGDTYDYGNSNLCAVCHQGRRNVDEYVAANTELSSRYGPHHGPQADMVVGTNAYEFEGYTYSNSWHSHGMEDGCLTCHFYPTDRYVLGGHSFWMETEEAGQNLDGCNSSACHDDELDDFNRSAFTDFDGDGEIEGVQTEIEGLMNELAMALLDAGLLEWNDEDGMYEPTDGLLVGDIDSVGAVFNYMFVMEDRSLGIHNTDYAVGLLQSSLNFIETGDPNGAPQKRSALLSAH